MTRTLFQVAAGLFPLRRSQIRILGPHLILIAGRSSVRVPSVPAASFFIFFDQAVILQDRGAVADVKPPLQSIPAAKIDDLLLQGNRIENDAISMTHCIRGVRSRMGSGGTYFRRCYDNRVAGVVPLIAGAMSK
jgi:hypothetical protein